jgi:hypothetical protein
MSRIHRAAIAVGAGALLIACAADGGAFPEPPPPSEQCSAPDLVSHSFDDGTYGPFSTQVQNGPMTIVSDPTATGGRAVQKQWTTGDGGAGMLTATWASAADGTLSRQTQRAFASFRLKQAAGFDNSGILKLVRFQRPGFGALIGSLIISNDQFQWTWDDLDANSQWMFVNVGADLRPSQLRGGWHTFEVMNDISVSGNLHVQVWIDGVLKMNHRAPWPNRGYTMGTVQFTGTLNPPGTNGTTWIDELAVSTKCIGPRR